MSLNSFAIRKMFEEGDKKRDAGLGTPDDIIRKDDIIYGPDKEFNVMDIYYPKDYEGKLPIIVSIHGGGWVYGDKNVYQYYCMSLAQRGFAVVNFTYRLAPEFKFPSSLVDTNYVMEWIVKNAEQYDLNTDYIFMVGDSAGAHMLTLYSCICTNSEYAKRFSFKVPNHMVPNAIALNCGAYDISSAISKNEMTRELMNDFLGKGVSEEVLNMVDALNHITKDFPPTFLMTSNGDFLKEDAPLMENKLKEFNIPYEYRLYGDDKNVLGHVFHCNIKLEDAKKCNDDECNFFKKFL